MENRPRPVRRILESELDKKSLETLRDYYVVITHAGVVVRFKSQPNCISGREYKALLKFGRDNKLLSSDDLVTNVMMNPYHVTAFFKCENAEGIVEKGGN